MQKKAIRFFILMVFCFVFVSGAAESGGSEIRFRLQLPVWSPDRL
jgi:hypothetical protein